MLTIVLSVLQCTASDYFFGIFKLFVSISILTDYKYVLTLVVISYVYNWNRDTC